MDKTQAELIENLRRQLNEARETAAKLTRSRASSIVQRHLDDATLWTNEITGNAVLTETPQNPVHLATRRIPKQT